MGSWLQTHRILLLFIALIFIARFSLIFCTEELWPSLERFYTGTVAKEMADGMAMPLWDYQFSSYEAGWLLAAIFCLPFFLLFGFTSFAMGFCGILVYIAQFALLYVLIERGTNRRVAIFFALQYLLAQYIFNLNALFVGFNYFNVVFLYAVFLFAYRKIFHSGRMHAVIGGPLLSLFGLGLLGGFSTWICYAFALIAIPCTVHWFVYYRSWDLRPIGSFLVGFVLGLSPLFFRVATFADGIKVDIIDKLVAQDLAGFLNKFWYFIGFEQSYGRSIYADYLEIIGAGLVVVVLLLQRARLGVWLKGVWQKPLEEQGEEGTILLLWLFPLVFLTIFCLSDFADYRYFAPVYPFVFAANAFAVDLLLSCKMRIWRGLGTLSLGLLLLFNVADSIIIPLYKVRPNLTLFHDKAYSYELLGCLVSWRFKENPKRVMRVTNRLSDDDKRTDLLRGFGFELAVNGSEQLITDYVVFFSDVYQHEPQFMRAYNKGLVLGLGHEYFDNTPLGEYYPEILRDIPRSEVDKYFEKQIQLINKVDRQYKPSCYTGLGFQFSALAEGYSLDANDVMRQMSAEYHDEFHKGIQLGQTYAYRL